MTVSSKNTKKLNKVVLIISVTSTTLLLLLYMNYVLFKSDFVLIGVVREMFTIPSLGAQPVIIFFSLRSIFLYGMKNNYLSLISLVISVATIIIFVKSVI